MDIKTSTCNQHVGPLRNNHMILLLLFKKHLKFQYENTSTVVGSPLKRCKKEMQRALPYERINKVPHLS